MLNNFIGKFFDSKVSTMNTISVMGDIGLYTQIINDLAQIASHAESVSMHPGVLITCALVKVGAKLLKSYFAKETPAST